MTTEVPVDASVDLTYDEDGTLRNVAVSSTCEDDNLNVWERLAAVRYACKYAMADVLVQLEMLGVEIPDGVDSVATPPSE